ncbi:putative transporter small subunit [Denitrificimonas caeni]|uniref:Transporter small subunit n=1 Tax=Denitrificimonas caeni TaxID=521720 RepID=A0AAF0AJW4_9GAMM|nr:putative transporter small subunit [Denitrificimonas caeni]WBE25930.1 putative transporter small subunit [Denitrificimonas caeni]
MSVFGLTVYVMIWPVLSAMVLIVLCTAVVIDARNARAKGESLI